MTFAEVVTRIRDAQSRDEIVDLALGYMRKGIEFGALFVVHESRISGWAASGVGAEGIKQIRLDAGSPSKLWMVIETKAHFLGPISDEDHAALAPLRRERPRAVLMIPLRVRGRVVVILFAENGPRAISPRVAANLMVFSTHLQEALEGLLLRRKTGMPQPGSGIPTGPILPPQSQVEAPQAAIVTSPAPPGEPEPWVPSEAPPPVSISAPGIPKARPSEEIGPSWGDAIDEVTGRLAALDPNDFVEQRDEPEVDGDGEGERAWDVAEALRSVPPESGPSTADVVPPQPEPLAAVRAELAREGSGTPADLPPIRAISAVSIEPPGPSAEPAPIPEPLPIPEQVDDDDDRDGLGEDTLLDTPSPFASDSILEAPTPIDIQADPAADLRAPPEDAAPPGASGALKEALDRLEEKLHAPTARGSDVATSSDEASDEAPILDAPDEAPIAADVDPSADAEEEFDIDVDDLEAKPKPVAGETILKIHDADTDPSNLDGKRTAEEARASVEASLDRALERTIDPGELRAVGAPATTPSWEPPSVSEGRVSSLEPPRRPQASIELPPDPSLSPPPRAPGRRPAAVCVHAERPEPADLQRRRRRRAPRDEARQRADRSVEAGPVLFTAAAKRAVHGAVQGPVAPWLAAARRAPEVLDQRRRLGRW